MKLQLESPSGLLLGALSLIIAGSQCSAATVSNSALLDQVAQSVSLPLITWSANGTHTAKGFTTKAANVTSVEGMKADCENINLNKKLAADFRSDVFGPGVIGFFYKCEKIKPDTNLYWFTISSGNQSQIEKLCDQNTKYPIVFDQQHSTWFIDEPFDCTQRTSPTKRSHLPH